MTYIPSFLRFLLKNHEYLIIFILCFFWDNVWVFFFVLLMWWILSYLLECKEIQPVHPKGNQSWLFFGRTDTEAEIPILWPPNVKNWLIRKDPDVGKDWRQEEKGMTEDEMVGWHHWLNGHEFQQALGVGDGQGSLECCSPWGCKESDTTETKWLNWTVLILFFGFLILNQHYIP